MTDLLEKLSAACVDLLYSSETDAPLGPFVLPGPFSIEALLLHHGKLRSVPPAAFAEMLAKASADLPTMYTRRSSFMEANASDHADVIATARAKAPELAAAVEATLAEPFAYAFGGNREVTLIGGKTDATWTALAPRLDAFQSDFGEANRPIIEGVEPPTSLVDITRGLALWEGDASPGNLHLTEPLWAVASTKERATIVDRTLAQTGFVHVKPTMLIDGQDDDTFEPLIELITSELTNVRTYFAGWSCEWDAYIVGETSDGEIAGVATFLVWT